VPNIKSVKKDVIRSRQRRLRNQSAKSQMRTFVKKANTAIAAGDENLTAVISKTVSVIDKIAKRGIIHKNAAARRKSRIMRRAAAAAAAQANAAGQPAA
jgi:small subunit ribosomal protein S20